MTGSCRLKAHPCCNVSNFLSKAEKHSITRSYPILFIPLSGHVGCFYLLAVVSHAAVNMGVQTSLRLFFLILLGVYLLIACLIFEAPPCFLFHCGCTVLQRYLLNRVFHWPYFLFWLSAHLPESQPDMAFDFWSPCVMSISLLTVLSLCLSCPFRLVELLGESLSHNNLEWSHNARFLLAVPSPSVPYLFPISCSYYTTCQYPINNVKQPPTS